MTNKIWRSILLISPLILMACLSLIYLDKPGLQNDEILYANLSLGEISKTTWIETRILGIPIFIISYIGALKAWIFVPIFKLFGFNYLSIRLPMILLGVLSLVYLYKTLKISLNKSYLPFMVLLTVASESTFITMTRTDVGPIAIEYFCKTISIYLVFKYLQKYNSKYLYFLPLPLAIGLFNKLNFIWFSNALIFGSVTLILLIKTKKDRFVFLKLLALSFITEFILLIVFNRLNSGIVRGSFSLNLESLTKKIELFYYFGKGIFDGTGFYRVQYLISEEFFGYNTFTKGIYKTFFFLFEFSLVLFLINLGITIKALLQKSYEKQDIYFLFFASLIGLISAQIFIVENATNLWHYYTLFPFFTICIIFSSNKLFGRKFNLFFVGLILIYNLNNYSTYVYALKNKVPNPFWSNKITELAEFIKPIKGNFVELDWGFSSQMLSLTKQDKFSQGFLAKNGHLYPTLEHPESVFFEEQIKNKDLKDLYFLTFQSHLADPKMNALFDSTIEKNGLKKILVKSFCEKDGTVIYSIFRLKKG